MAISLNSIFALLALAIGYLLGSIPFGLILTRIAGTKDLRAIGSGNIGATNVLRTGRKDLAAATLVLDALKATLGYLLAGRCFMTKRRRSPARPAPSSATSILSGSAFAAARASRPSWAALIGACWPAALGFAIVWLAVGRGSRAIRRPRRSRRASRRRWSRSRCVTPSRARFRRAGGAALDQARPQYRAASRRHGIAHRRKGENGRQIRRASV